MVLDVRGLLLTPPGLGGDWLTDDVSGPGVRPSYLDGGDPEVVPDNPRLDWKNKGSGLKPGRWRCSGQPVCPMMTRSWVQIQLPLQEHQRPASTL